MIETAREQVAELIGAHARDVIFTSCATESNNAAIAAALKANPSVSRPSRVAPPAFIVELPFADRFVGSVEFVYQLMLRTNHSHYAVLKPGYLGKSYQLASAVTRVAEKPLTCSEHIANVECPSSS